MKKKKKEKKKKKKKICQAGDWEQSSHDREDDPIDLQVSGLVNPWESHPDRIIQLYLWQVR
jgi:hypothetical protein